METTTEHGRAKIVVFVLLTLAISSAFYYRMIVTGSAGQIGLFWMWSPGLAAIATQLLFRGSLRDFGWRLGEKRWLFWGFTIPVLYAALIYGVAWATGLAGFQRPRPAMLPLIPVGFVNACVAALGEEIGWRGLLIPELLKVTTFTKASIITGIIWGIWHYPAIVFTEYNSDAPLWFNLLVPSIGVFGMSLFTAWLRLKTGSIWPAVLWHGSHNLFIQTVFLSMTTDTGITEYVVDDFGVGVLLAALGLGYIFWRKRSELPPKGKSWHHRPKRWPDR